MSVTAGQRRIRPVLAAILTLAMLVPVALLFVRTRQTTTGELDRTRTERQAIEYLTRLTPLLSAVTEAQFTALRGRTGELAAVGAAVAGVEEIDKRLGVELGVQKRWVLLRARLDKLPSAGNPLAVLEAHVEAGDLLLALYDAIRDRSGLTRDPDTDISHMQRAVAVDLPRTVILATRSADLALLAGGATGAERQALAGGLAAASAGTGVSVNDLTRSLHGASDDTLGGTVSSSVLGTFDAFRRAIESITRGVNGGQAADPGQITAAYGELQQGLTALATTVLSEMDKLLVTRADAARDDQDEQVVIAAAAVLAAVLILVVLLVPGRRRTGATTQRRREDLHADVGPPRAEVASTGRERSGALR
jgi:hypothetical protein